MTWEDEQSCPICHSEQMVYPYGPERSKILIVSEFPGGDEIKMGRPMVGRNGTVLRQELGRVGIDLRSLRICNLWLHPKNEDAGCLTHSAKLVLKECRGRKFVLLLGSEPVKYFTGLGVMNVAGLVVTSELITKPILFACPQAAIVFHGGCGEFRLSMEKFAKLVNGR